MRASRPFALHMSLGRRGSAPTLLGRANRAGCKSIPQIWCETMAAQAQCGVGSGATSARRESSAVVWSGQMRCDAMSRAEMERDEMR